MSFNDYEGDDDRRKRLYDELAKCEAAYIQATKKGTAPKVQFEAYIRLQDALRAVQES